MSKENFADFHPGGNKQVDKCTAILEATTVKVNTCILSQGVKEGENFWLRKIVKGVKGVDVDWEKYLNG